MIIQSTNVEFSISCRIQHLLEPHLMQKRFYYLLRQKIMVFIFNILELIQSYWNYYSIYYNIYTICNYIVYILSTTSAPAGSRWTTQVRLLQSLAETALFICYQTHSRNARQLGITSTISLYIALLVLGCILTPRHLRTECDGLWLCSSAWK